MNKAIPVILLGVLAIGITQFAFAEEVEKISHITVDKKEFEQPKSKYNNQEIKIGGFIEDYARGEQITIIIISPDKSTEEINTYASKKGDLYTLLHITHESQVGIHQLIINYQDVTVSTSFEILENQ